MLDDDEARNWVRLFVEFHRLSEYRDCVKRQMVKALVADNLRRRNDEEKIGHITGVG